MAGLQCAWQVEIDAFARKVLDKHWPSVPKYEDIRTFEPTYVDVVCGGFPCQDISVAGRGKGLAGERSGLWREMLRVVCTIRPRYVVIENVAALLIRGMDTVLWDIAALGYDAEWSTVSACSLGAPHTRDRLFIVAYRNEKRWRRLRFCNEREDAVGSRYNAWQAAPRANGGTWSAGLGRLWKLATGSQLPPSVAEWMMGFPIGWTDLEHVETRLCLKLDTLSEKQL